MKQNRFGTWGSSARNSSILLLVSGVAGLAGCGADWEAQDRDGDGYSVAQGDCWDDPLGPEGSGLTGDQIHPGAAETWYDGIDQDCAGDDDYDADGDGWVTETAYLGLSTLGVPGSGGDAHQGAGDCWDVPVARGGEAHPVVTADYGADGNPFTELTAADVHPGAAETWYDGVDQDCGGDDDFDQDGDGFRTALHLDLDGQAGDDCADGSWREELPDDVDPAEIHPGALEVCDDVDNDCNGLVDGDDPDVDPASVRTFYADADGDGYGDAAVETETCSAPSGYVEDDTDCDDGDADVYPGADEVCDGVDQDCDDEVDEDATDAPTWYADADEDGYGDAETSQAACEQPSGYVEDATDCDDGDATAHPGAEEVCDGVDNDCDAEVDEDDAVDAPTWYQDGDGDGYGDAAASTVACEAPIGFVADGGDCDDGDDAINPAATEVCDGVDNDCDGAVDDDDTGLDTSTGGTFYADADGDGYGDAASTTMACEAPSGYVTDDTDCDDGDADVNPGAAEVCNDGIDNDCTAGETDPGGVCAPSSGPLSDANLVIKGGVAGMSLGTTVAAGDFDGDGTDDIVLGAPGTTVVENAGGAAYVVAGSASLATLGSSSTVAVRDVDVATVAGDGSYDYLGGAVAVGDLDGDGYDDLVVGSPLDNDGARNNGTAYLMFGPVTGAIVGTGDADCVFSGTEVDGYAGQALSLAGDLDGDGVVDLVVGSSGHKRVTGAGASPTELGLVDVVDGASLLSGCAAVAPAASLTADAADGAGFALLVADVDGDGQDDLVAGAPAESTGGTDAGAVYVLAGPVTAGGDWTGADTWFAEAAGDEAGHAVASAGDVDGDGYEDVLVGAPFADGAAGAVYLLAGPLTAAGASHGLADAAARVAGDSGSDKLGWSMVSLGDLDGDGNDDVALGAITAEDAGTDAGSVALFYGPLSGSLAVADADVIYTGGTSKDWAGHALATGDVNGDGTPDLLVGAPQAEPGGSANEGAAYLILGLSR